MKNGEETSHNVRFTAMETGNVEAIDNFLSANDDLKIAQDKLGGIAISVALVWHFLFLHWRMLLVLQKRMLFSILQILCCSMMINLHTEHILQQEATFAIPRIGCMCVYY